MAPKAGRLVSLQTAGLGPRRRAPLAAHQSLVPGPEGSDVDVSEVRLPDVKAPWRDSAALPCWVVVLPVTRGSVLPSPVRVSAWEESCNGRVPRQLLKSLENLW